MGEVVEQILSRLCISYEENVDLSLKTWLKTGGKVKYWVKPDTIDKLRFLIQELNDRNIRYDVVGHTSNIYFLDSYCPFIIISTIKLCGFSDNGKILYCECGTPVSRLSSYSIEKGYKGFYGLVNLPGTVAAAVVNNSSCFDCCLSEQIIEITYIDLCTNELKVLLRDELGLRFRNSFFKEKEIQGVILSVKLLINEGTPEEEKQKADEAKMIRKETQEAPAYTLGSVFAGLKAKQTIHVRICEIIEGALRRMGLLTKSRSIMIKLLLFGFLDLKPFISQRNINTFIWLPKRKDKHDKFKRYLQFVNTIYDNPRMEIEVRG